jgi:hypothetical protein
MSLCAASKQHRRKFTKEEDERLKKLVKKYGTKKWEEIASYMPKRCGRQCRNRYFNSLVENLKKGPWTAEEDALVMRKYGEIGAHWVQISRCLIGRSGNDVKNRWYKILSKRFNQSREATGMPMLPGIHPTIDLAREIQSFCEGQTSFLSDFREDKATWDFLFAGDEPLEFGRA